MNQQEQKARESLKHRPRLYEKFQHFTERQNAGISNAMIRVEYSYACNMHCKHCCVADLMGKSDRRALTVADVKDLADQADAYGLAQFVITGGEPLIFKEFDDIVAAIDPQRFYITTDTNGYFLDADRARHLKEIGVDKVQISLDSMIESEHDEFREKQGAWRRAVEAIEQSKRAGLKVLVQTTLDSKRAWSQEFINFLEYFKALQVPVFVGFLKPVGAWAGQDLVKQADIDHVAALREKYDVFTHMTPAYDYPGGCIMVRRMVTVTKYGDVLPCIFMHKFNIGNIFEDKLSTILERGMNMFARQDPSCPMAVDEEFIRSHD